MNRQLLSEPSNFPSSNSSTFSFSVDGGRTKVHHNAKLTPEIVWEIRQRYNLNTDGGKVRRGQMQRWLANHFKLPLGTVCKILRYTSWKQPAVGVSWEDWEKENGRTST